MFEKNVRYLNTLITVPNDLAHNVVQCKIFCLQTVVPSVPVAVTLSLAVISANQDGSYLAVHNVCKLKCSNRYMKIHLLSDM